MSNQSRRDKARDTRSNAAGLAANRPHPRHLNNGEEYLYRRDCGTKPSHIANYTKGLPHDSDPKSDRAGLLTNSHDYHQFVLGIQSGDIEDFDKTPLGPGAGVPTPDALTKPAIHAESGARDGVWQSQVAKSQKGKDGLNGAELRAWESAGGGLQFELQGPDPHSVTMPPAPRLDSPEYAAEVAEVYLMALLRDTHVSQLRAADLGGQCGMPTVAGCACACPPSDLTVDDAGLTLCDVNVAHADQYDCLTHAQGNEEKEAGTPGKNWFKLECCDLDDQERARHRTQVDRQHIFRGIAPGDDVGPYLSQFMLVGNNSRGDGYGIDAGYVEYGALRVDQWVRVATPCKDYMTNFKSWVDVQNAADVGGAATFCPPSASKTKAAPACRDHPAFRFITTPRDMATYVHYDALYEAYLNACLILMGLKAPYDPGLPFGTRDIVDHQQGFAHFGGPHILTLVTEVATRALKAVRYQKFNTHRRLRPEAIAGLIDRYKNGINPHGKVDPLRPRSDKPASEKDCVRCASEGELDPIKPLVDALDGAGLLKRVKTHNARQNENHWKADGNAGEASYFLPMAFPEGSPMHPAYGAGHATVAGACVTVLKAFFDHGWHLPFRDDDGNPVAYEPNADGTALVPLKLCRPLTVEGELNKLAANISIARNWAGVHYFTDYIESLRMGEQIAIGILEEQRLTYGENFTMTVPLFDGTSVRI